MFRSAVLARVWAAVGSLLAGEPAPRVLLALRLLNTLIFALAVGAATGFAVATVTEPFPQWLTFAFLFVPSLPFFAMHVSETALLCSIYVVLGTGLAVMFLDCPRAHWAGAPVGLATGLMLAGGRSPWPLAGLVALALLGRVVLGSREAPRSLRAALVFWGGFALGAAVFYPLLNDDYVRMVRVHTRFVPSSLRPASEWLLGQRAALLGLVAGAGILEAASRPWRDAVGKRMAQPTRWLARRAGPAPAVLVLVSLAASLFIDYPHLIREPPRPLTAPERVAAVLGSMATMFRLNQPDFLLASSFWVGFGWLDTMPKPPFQAVVVALVALAAAALFVHVGRYQQVRRFLWCVPYIVDLSPPAWSFAPSQVQPLQTSV